LAKLPKLTGKELADKGVEKSGLYLLLAISRAFGEYT